MEISTYVVFYQGVSRRSILRRDGIQQNANHKLPEHGMLSNVGQYVHTYTAETVDENQTIIFFDGGNQQQRRICGEGQQIEIDKAFNSPATSGIVIRHVTSRFRSILKAFPDCYGVRLVRTISMLFGCFVRTSNSGDRLMGTLSCGQKSG